MRIKHGFALVAASVILSTAGVAIAESNSGDVSNCAPNCVRNNPVKIGAPEIDATSGIQALALLSGILLLVSERKRRRTK